MEGPGTCRHPFPKWGGQPLGCPPHYHDCLFLSILLHNKTQTVRLSRNSIVATCGLSPSRFDTDSVQPSGQTSKGQPRLPAVQRAAHHLAPCGIVQRHLHPLRKPCLTTVDRQRHIAVGGIRREGEGHATLHFRYALFSRLVMRRGRPMVYTRFCSRMGGHHRRLPSFVTKNDCVNS